MMAASITRKFAWRLPQGVSSASDVELHASVNACENWEKLGGATVAFGVVVAVIIAAIHPRYDSFLEQWGSVISDGLVALGVVVEVGLGQIASTRQKELNRRSDEKVAEANKDAAEARKRTAEIEQLTAFRHVDPDTRKEIIKGFGDKLDVLKLSIEFQQGDTEAWSFAREFAEIFNQLGYSKIIFRANSHIGFTAFGVHVNVGTGEDGDIVHAIAEKVFGIKLQQSDLKRYAIGQDIPNLYLFIGPKPPPPLMQFED